MIKIKVKNSPKYDPPPDFGQKVVLAPPLEGLVVSQGVVEPPQPGGDPVRDHHVDTVVTASQQKEDHASHTRAQGEPVEQEKTTRRI